MRTLTSRYGNWFNLNTLPNILLVVFVLWCSYVEAKTENYTLAMEVAFEARPVRANFTLKKNSRLK